MPAMTRWSDRVGEGRVCVRDGHVKFETGAVALETGASSVRHACDDKME